MVRTAGGAIRSIGAGSRRRATRWEADHDKLEINVLPLRGKRLVRP
jgi:hypothetical protein